MCSISNGCCSLWTSYHATPVFSHIAFAYTRSWKLSSARCWERANAEQNGATSCYAPLGQITRPSRISRVLYYAVGLKCGCCNIYNWSHLTFAVHVSSWSQLNCQFLRSYLAISTYEVHSLKQRALQSMQCIHDKLKYQSTTGLWESIPFAVTYSLRLSVACGRNCGYYLFRPPGPAWPGGLYILLLSFLFLPELIDENRPSRRPPILYQQCSPRAHS